MEKTLVVALPIEPGKTEMWKEFMHDLNGPRFREYQESRRKAGVKEQIFLQTTSDGDIAIWVLQGDNPEKAITYFSTSNDHFARDFINRVKDLHGIDLSEYNATTIGELYVDSEIKSVTTH
jgi:hypothetical protein